jgi:hypothetical protein
MPTAQTVTLTEHNVGTVAHSLLTLNISGAGDAKAITVTIWLR